MKEKPGTVTPPIGDKKPSGKMRSAEERTVPMFDLAVLAPAEAEARAMKERARLEAASRRKVAKSKREAAEAAVDKGIDDFNDRTGTS